jgi:hypothetical protein
LGISGTVRPYSSLKAYLGEISTDEGIKGLGLLGAKFSYGEMR